MKINIQNKWLYLLLLFLLVLNAATIGTILVHISRDKIRNQQITTVGNPAPPRTGARGVGFYRALNSLNLTTEQRELFLQYRMEYLEQTKLLFQQLRIYRTKINQELGKPKPSKRKIKRYAKKIGQLHQQLTYNQAIYYLNLAKECTPEQRDSLYKIYIKYQNVPGYGGRGPWWKRNKK